LPTFSLACLLLCAYQHRFVIWLPRQWAIPFDARYAWSACEEHVKPIVATRSVVCTRLSQELESLFDSLRSGSLADGRRDAGGCVVVAAAGQCLIETLNAALGRPGQRLCPVCRQRIFSATPSFTMRELIATLPAEADAQPALESHQLRVIDALLPAERQPSSQLEFVCASDVALSLCGTMID
jgi:hypothetical protein